MAVALASTTTAIPTAASTTVVFTLGSSPPTGSLLVASVAFSQYQTARTLTPPAGWLLLGTNTLNSTSLSVYYRVAGAAEPTTVTFTINGSSADWGSGQIMVFSGAATTAPTIAIGSGSTATPTSPGLIPTVSGSMPVATFAQDTSNFAGANITSAAGWTIAGLSETQYHPSAAFYQSPVAQTSTPISCVASPSTAGNPADYNAATILVAPLQSVPAVGNAGSAAGAIGSGRNPGGAVGNG